MNTFQANDTILRLQAWLAMIESDIVSHSKDASVFLARLAYQRGFFEGFCTGISVGTGQPMWQFGRIGEADGKYAHPDHVGLRAYPEAWAGELQFLAQCVNDLVSRIEEEHPGLLAKIIQDGHDGIFPALKEEKKTIDIKVQHDRSGQGHAWRDVAIDDLPAVTREWILAEAMESREKSGVCEAVGLHYRWTKS